MSKPICVECKVEYSCEKNEVLVNDPAVGEFPATYWRADRWICPGCNHQVIVGRGKSMFLDSVSPGDDADGPVVHEWENPAESFEFNHNLPTEKLEVKNE